MVIPRHESIEKHIQVSFSCFPFKAFAAFAGRAWAGGCDCNRPRPVRLGGEVAMIDQRHEHGVAAHQVDPSKRFGIARNIACDFFQNDCIGGSANELAIGCLQRHTALAQVDDLEFYVLRRRTARGGDYICQCVVLRIREQATAVGTADECNRLARRGQDPIDRRSSRRVPSSPNPLNA